MKTALRDSGFTLIEILVALAMILIILGIAYAAYAGATESVSRCRVRTAVEQEARAVLQRMAREIRCCYLWPPPVTADRGAARTTHEDARPAFLGKGRFDRAEMLQFVTAGGILKPDQPNAGLSVVAYRFEESRHALLRAQAGFMETGDPFADDDRWWLVARDIQKVGLRFFDGENWHGEWDSDDKGELPRAVSIELTLGIDSAEPATYSYTAWIAHAQWY